MRKFPHYLFVFLLIFSCTEEEEPDLQPQQPLEYKALTDVSYGTHSRQVYDIYLPANRNQDTKTMILVHGGGWTSGSKAEMNDYKDVIREQLPDVAVVNMNYRLAGPDLSPYPMQIEDISALVSDLSAKKGEYHIGEDIGFIGASAGGHLALLWSYGYDVQNRVKMVCSIVGPTNLLDEAYLNASSEELKELIAQFGFEESQLQVASPLYRATADSPPTILFYGGQDPLIPNS